jgi:alpha-glucosidase
MAAVESLTPSTRPAPSDGGKRSEAGSSAAPWWQQAVFYQVYPLSFQDTDGDGRGDLAGVSARLDHLAWLGVDAVWLGPVFPSPMHDFGYDIADFTGVDPVFGSLEEFDRLLASLHQRGMRLVLDFVPNHSSDRHPWFIESRSSRHSLRRDWYVWADAAADGGPPNNWVSRFGGSAWEWDESSGQYYYHAFLKQQPDLNWHNPRVREAMADVLRFWLRRGVDGFRLDACAVLAQDRLLRDDPPNPDASADTPPPDRHQRVYTNYRPEVLDWLADLRRAVDAFPDRVLLGEVDGAGERIAHFYGDAERPILHLPLNYRLHETDWKARALRQAIEDYLDLLPPHAWPNWLLGGHDKKRIVDVVGAEQARVAAMLQFTLPGTSVLYQGDELGVPGAEVPSGQARDPFEQRLPGYGLNRDAERAPLPWNGSAHAGFTAGTPWLPLARAPVHGHAEQQRDDPRSPLALYRALIALRQSEPALRSCHLRMDRGRGDVLGYERGEGERRLRVLLNLGERERHVRGDADDAARLVLSTHLDRHDETCGRRIVLRPHEGIVLVRDRRSVDVPGAREE